MSKRRAIIVGAGPAGLTAAYELLKQSDIEPVVLEMSTYMGGIARTVEHHGNRIDIGGHRFFSKSDRVMEWWLDVMPVESVPGRTTKISYQRKTRDVATESTVDPETEDLVMLVRDRRSRIYYLRKFFDYPISLSLRTLGNLGLLRSIRIGLSYLKSLALPIRRETNLEHFLVNRFGRELYLTFFKSYTEKVWGTACDQISAEWGAQRIKGLSIVSALKHFFRSLLPKKDTGDVAQKGTETSLIERFLYPKLGPGQLWEEVAERVVDMGGEIRTRARVTALHTDGARVLGVTWTDLETGEDHRVDGDFVFSTMPIQELMAGLEPAPPAAMREISDGLVYRDFLTVGLLVDDLKIHEDAAGSLIKDNWIYVQEPDVQVGRLQIFNNWSPYMVADPSKVWLGLEYFCNETDDLWRMSDEALIELGKEELERIDIIDKALVSDAVVIKMPKTYPAYFGSYDRFDELRSYLDGFENLFLVGRNGMHRYNNQDHSMLTAMMAVENILSGRRDKANLWAVNTEEEYHEEKS